LFGITLNVQPGEFGFVVEGRKAIISDGVVYSLPWQNGQNPPLFLCEGETKSVGRFPLSTEIITHLPEIGSFLNSDIYPPIIRQKVTVFVTVTVTFYFLIIIYAFRRFVIIISQ
jgi:hypothetical protein